jgi:hypothetical protein
MKQISDKLYEQLVDLLYSLEGCKNRRDLDCIEEASAYQYQQSEYPLCFGCKCRLMREELQLLK